MLMLLTCVVLTLFASAYNQPLNSQNYFNYNNGGGYSDGSDSDVQIIKSELVSGPHVMVAPDGQIYNVYYYQGRAPVASGGFVSGYGGGFAGGDVSISPNAIKSLIG